MQRIGLAGWLFAAVSLLGCVAAKPISDKHVDHEGLCNIGMMPDGRIQAIHWCDCGAEWTNTYLKLK